MASGSTETSETHARVCVFASTRVECGKCAWRRADHSEADRRSTQRRVGAAHRVTPMEVFDGCIDASGWVELTTFNNAGEPPPPAYIWDLLWRRAPALACADGRRSRRAPPGPRRPALRGEPQGGGGLPLPDHC